jgi:hypothetical protein
VTVPTSQRLDASVLSRPLSEREPTEPHGADRRYVTYSLLGPTLEPSAVTARAGLSADTSWRAGEPHPRGGRITRVGYWSVESGLPPSVDVEPQLDALLARLRPGWPGLVALGTIFEATVTIAVYCEEAQGPAVIVRPRVSAALAELNASIDVDIYTLHGGPAIDTRTGEVAHHFAVQPTADQSSRG